MPIRVYIDGAVRPPEEAKVSVLDRGFLYGDSVYETIGTIHGRLFAARDHLDRLERSAQPDRPARAAARRDRSGDRRDGRRRRQSRDARARDPDPRRGQAGSGSGVSCDDSRLVVIAFPLGPADAGDVREGRRGGDRVGHAQQPARDRSGGEVRQLPQQRARAGRGAAHAAARTRRSCARATAASPRARPATCSRSCGGEVLDAAARRRHPGRHHAREGAWSWRAAPASPLVERRIQPDELRGADEAFLTSATRGVLPITTIDGRPVGAGVPGPVTQRLMALYDELARRGVE